MSSVVVVWVLDEVDGVGAGVLVLIHLEVSGRESKRPQDHVPQVFQLTCTGEGVGGVTEVRHMFHILKSVI